MAGTHSRPRRPARATLDQNKPDEVVPRARGERDQRLEGYREQALRLCR
ncbi:MAG: hypothetical protein ACREWE_00290 [Gammaproteobacteria bacterium]